MSLAAGLFCKFSSVVFIRVESHALWQAEPGDDEANNGNGKEDPKDVLSAKRSFVEVSKEEGS
jgi:hypothetical protein